MSQIWTIKLLNMKKIYSISFILLCYVSGYSQILDIVDTNFKNCLLASNSSNEIAKNLEGNYFKIDANNDNEIEASEAMQVSFLNLYPETTDPIFSIDGIKHFNNLEVLECHHNNLTTLDISEMPHLTALYCNDSFVQQLDLHGCAALTTLICSRNTIGSLDLSSCSNLVALQCDRNALTTLDVSNCTNLDQLFCQYNQLTSLYIKNGHVESQIHFQANPDLNYVCADDMQVESIQNQMSEWGQSCAVTSSCQLAVTEPLTVDSMTVYPNPASTVLNIETAKVFSAVRIYNMLGQMMIEMPNADSAAVVDVSGLSRGTYLLKITSDSGNTNTKFIKN